MNEKELQEVENEVLRLKNKGWFFALDALKLIAEVRRLKIREKKSAEIIQSQKDRHYDMMDYNDKLTKALEHIKETCKDAGAYTKLAEAYRIAKLELEGEE